MSWDSFLSGTSDVVTAGAAAFAAWQAYLSLSTWRAETIGRRRFEVAEDTLTTFYRMQDVIYDARAPMVWSGELEAHRKEGEERPDEFQAPLLRLKANSTFLAEFRTKRHTFSAFFGAEKAKNTFDAMEKILVEIRAAASTALDAPKDDKFRQGGRKIAFRMGQDELTPRVEEIVSGTEAICRPVIESEGRERSNPSKMFQRWWTSRS